MPCLGKYCAWNALEITHCQRKGSAENQMDLSKYGIWHAGPNHSPKGSWKQKQIFACHSVVVLNEIPGKIQMRLHNSCIVYGCKAKDLRGRGMAQWGTVVILFVCPACFILFLLFCYLMLCYFLFLSFMLSCYFILFLFCFGLFYLLHVAPNKCHIHGWLCIHSQPAMCITSWWPHNTSHLSCGRNIKPTTSYSN